MALMKMVESNHYEESPKGSHYLHDINNEDRALVQSFQV